MTNDTDITISALIEKRDALAKSVNTGEVDEYDPAYDPIMTQLEQIDWQIVHTEAQTLIDLRLKFERMCVLNSLVGFKDADSNIQTAFAKSLLDDLQRMS